VDDGGHMKGFLISAAAGLLACTALAAGAAPSQAGGNIDLRLTSANGKYGAVFEVEQKLIGSFRLGLIGPVGYIEGCS